jgi:hypothetical protein
MYRALSVHRDGKRSTGGALESGNAPPAEQINRQIQANAPPVEQINGQIQANALPVERLNRNALPAAEQINSCIQRAYP